MLNSEFIQYIEDKLNLKIKNAVKLTHGSYNDVYKLETTGKNLILRIFASKSWPENGKLEFINDQLTKYNILTANILILERDSNFFEKGFIIQEFIEGNDLGDIIGDKISYSEYFKKLANVLKSIHNIKIQNCGYIGTGIASHKSFEEFIVHEYENTKKDLLYKKMFNEKELNKYIDIVLEIISKNSGLPFVLCHNDISESNVILNKSGNLVLIDWDNAVSGTWVSDFAIMTFWMRISYDIDDYKSYRNIFLNEYNPNIEYSKIDSIEKACHLFQCLNLANYYTDEQKINKIMNYLTELTKTVV